MQISSGIFYNSKDCELFAVISTIQDKYNWYKKATDEFKL